MQSKTNLMHNLRAAFELRNKLGIRDWILFLFKTVLYAILRYAFKFDPWHVIGIYEIRLYKRVVVKIANQFRPSVVAEIGCGLGEIISRIDTKERIGIDSDGAVLRAARFLNWLQHISFIEGSFNAVKDLPFAKIDLLIMVNWLHGIPETTINRELDQLLRRKKIKYVIADEILEHVKGYKYHHKLGKNLGNMFRELKKVEDPEGIRRIVVLESL